MEKQDAHFRHILLYYLRKGKNTSQAHKKLYTVYENEALKDLFRSMQNSSNGKIFNDADYVKLHLIQFFAGKNQKFYEHGIMTLPEKWQKVIDKNRQYLIE